MKEGRKVGLNMCFLHTGEIGFYSILSSFEPSRERIRVMGGEEVSCGIMDSGGRGRWNKE